MAYRSLSDIANNVYIPDLVSEDAGAVRAHIVTSAGDSVDSFGTTLTDYATQTTLALVKAKTDNLDIALSALRDALRGVNSKTLSDLATLLAAGLPAALVSGRLDVNVGNTPTVAKASTVPHHYVSAASTNATSVVGAASTLYGIQASNVNAAVRYLKLYNKASAPTVGTDTPVLTYAIPGNTAAGGTNIPLPEGGVGFSLGIAFALTTEATDAGNTAVAADEIVINLQASA